MSALEFIVDLLARGVRFSIDGDKLKVRDLGMTTTPAERALVGALKPMIRSLLLTELPPGQALVACPAFSAELGVALCRDCGFGLPDHFWRTPACRFFAGAPATDKLCKRCGVPWLEHIPMEVQS